MADTASGIYVIRNGKTGDIYVGQTSNFHARKYTHWRELRRNISGSTHLQNAFNKYGEDSFSFESVLTCPVDSLNAFEQDAIERLKPKYNICPFGTSKRGLKASEETKKRMSESQKKRDFSHLIGRKIPEETRQRMSESHKKRPLTEERIRQLNEARKLRIFSDEWRRKNSEAKRGTHRSEETKEKISKSMMGKPQPWNRHPLSGATKQKMSVAALHRKAG